MKRGDISIVAIPGDYGKPRPAVIVQSDLLTREGARSVIICAITSDLRQGEAFRILVEPTPETGLKKISHIMADKIFTLPREKVENIVGKISDDTLIDLNRSLALVIGLAQ